MEQRLESIEKIKAAGGVAPLRQSLAARYPALAPGKFDKIIILGAADEGRRLLNLCREHGITVDKLVDDDPKRRAEGVDGFAVDGFDSLTDADRSIPVIIASHRTLGAYKRLKDLGFETVVPFAFLQVVDGERFPPHMFYDGWLEDLADNVGHYERFADLLADDFSRQVLDAVLAYRLTLDPTVMEPVIDWDLYLPRDGLSYANDEVIVDAGAYDGDSVALFLDRIGAKLKQAYAFEPDPVTYTRLEARFADNPSVSTVNKGVFDKIATLKFDDAGTRGSILVDDGGITVEVVDLDGLIPDAEVTTIKMNIEGAELAALTGAKSLIAKNRPKLLISAYHRPSDLWEVAEKIGEISDGYEYRLRQHDGGVIETVVYALPKQ